MSSSSLVLPCLAFHRAADRSTVLFSVPEKRPITGADDIDEPPLANKTILPTARGYVLAHDPTSSPSTFLYSPHSRRKISLPPLTTINQDLLIHYNCLLSDDPTGPGAGCVVLLVELDDPFIWYHRIAGGDGDHQNHQKWHKYEYDIGSQRYDAYDPTLLEKTVITPIAACRGRFYFNPMKTELGVIDFSSSSPGAGAGPGPAFGSIAAVEFDDERATHALDYLVESQGELYMVELPLGAVGDQVSGAIVHVMDFESSRWRRVGDLGGRAFVLSLFNFGASCEAGGRTGLREDCVYMAYPVARKLVVFDVTKDGSMETVKLDDAPAANKAFWVLPPS